KITGMCTGGVGTNGTVILQLPPSVPKPNKTKYFWTYNYNDGIKARVQVTASGEVMVNTAFATSINWVMNIGW
ncbi:MAG TPA: hypothetical protein GX707_12950, partial [Epulopiscium sp.]|nr:hypothetical protein [Candidatus Epulonipiscium sp.]